MPEFTLIISGDASVPHSAERAWVKLAATTSGDNKQAVSDSVLTTAEHIENQVMMIQDKYQKPPSSESANVNDLRPIAHWSKTSLTSTSQTQWINNSTTTEPMQKRTFTAEITFDIRFRDFNALGDFSARLSALDHCEVTGISWRLLPATKQSFQSRLRKEAAANALAKAKDYCAVLCNEDKVRIIPFKVIMQMQSARGFSSVNSSGLAFTPQECRIENFSPPNDSTPSRPARHRALTNPPTNTRWRNLEDSQLWRHQRAFTLWLIEDTKANVRTLQYDTLTEELTKEQQQEYATKNSGYSAKQKLANTPSIQHGMTLKEEREARAKGVSFIQQVGILIKVPQITITTAIVFYHRFLMRASLKRECNGIPKFHPFQIAATTLFLALKVEETPRKIKDTIQACCQVAQHNPSLKIDEQSKDYWRWREQFSFAEDIVLEILCFDVSLVSPHRVLFDLLKRYNIEHNKRLRNAAWAFVSDATSGELCLLMDSQTIAATALYAACRLCKVDLPEGWTKSHAKISDIQQAVTFMLEWRQSVDKDGSNGAIGADGKPEGGSVYEALQPPSFNGSDPD